MRNGWLIATVLGGTAAAAHGADVRIFGVNTPASGKWAVYAQVTNTSSRVPNAPNVSGISSIGVNILNASGNTATGAINVLPSGTTPYTEPADGKPVRYGFSFQDNGKIGAEPVMDGVTATGRVGIWGIDGFQDSLQDPPTNPPAPPSPVPYAALVLSGVGITAGSQGLDANHTSTTVWSAPVVIARGTYTPASPNAVEGLQFEYSTQIVNLLRATGNPDDPWTREEAVGKIMVDAKTGVTSNKLTKAGLGDATLDGMVDFDDLLVLAQNYNASAGKTWFQGDFTYDGAVDFDDLLALAQKYNQAVPADGLPSAFAADVAAAFAQVPEPGTLGAVGLGIGGLLMGRRKKRA